MRDDLKAELVLDALGMAVTIRGGNAAGVVAHSDHGSQYTSLVYGTYAKQSGIDLSMGSIGDPWDNARRRELLRLTRERTPPPRALPDPRTGQTEDLLVHRMLLQPPPQTLQPRHAQPDRLRTTTPTGGHRGLTTRCHGNGLLPPTQRPFTLGHRACCLRIRARVPPQRGARVGRTGLEPPGAMGAEGECGPEWRPLSAGVLAAGGGLAGFVHAPGGPSSTRYGGCGAGLPGPTVGATTPLRASSVPRSAGDPAWMQGLRDGRGRFRGLPRPSEAPSEAAIPHEYRVCATWAPFSFCPRKIARSPS